MSEQWINRSDSRAISDVLSEVREAFNDAYFEARSTEALRAHAKDMRGALNRLLDMTDPPKPQYTRLVGRCIGCFHDFRTGPCGGCGAVDRPAHP